MRSLLSTLEGPLSAFHFERLAMIDETDYSGIRRKVSEELHKLGIVVDDAYLDEGILALKQYYAIALLDPRNEHAVSDMIDPFWHAHILHTRDYRDFCDRVFGQYIDHTPLDHSDHPEVERIGSLYVYSVRVYSDFFNYVNPQFFPGVMPDERLICFHSKVPAAQVWNAGLLPEIPIEQIAIAA